jgi:hypothetical protein
MTKYYIMNIIETIVYFTSMKYTNIKKTGISFRDNYNINVVIVDNEKQHHNIWRKEKL